MKNFKKLFAIANLGLLVFSSSIVLNTAYAVERAIDNENIVAAHHAQRRTMVDKRIHSELHRHRHAKKRLASKHLKKKMAKISHTQHNQVSRIIINGNKGVNSATIKSIIKPYKSGGITRKEAMIISNKIEERYRKSGYFLPVVNITADGSALRVNIIEGKIKKVFVEPVDKKRDKKIFKNKRFLDLVSKIEKLNPTKTKKLQRYLLLINKIHGYTAEYEIKPLPQIQGNNVANMIIRVATQRGEATLSIDDAGTSDLGRYQIGLAAQAFNVISNDSLMLNLGTSNKPRNLKLITAGYLKRLNSYGTSASILGSYMEDDPRLGSGSKDNETTILKGRLDQYIILNNEHSLKLELGAEHRDVKHYSISTKTNDYDYVLGSVGAKIKIVDFFDVENWFFLYYNWALDNVCYNADNSADPINFDKNFNFVTVDWYRNQPLPRNFSLFLKASYQGTNKTLPREHLYTINTTNTARGYDTGLVSADEGISGTAELRYTHEFKKRKAMGKFLNSAQIFVFYDVTHFIDHNETAERLEHPNAVFFNRSTFQAGGAGLRLFFPCDFYAQGTLELPFHKHTMVNGVRNKNDPIFRFVISKIFSW